MDRVLLATLLRKLGVPHRAVKPRNDLLAAQAQPGTSKAVRSWPWAVVFGWLVFGCAGKATGSGDDPQPEARCLSPEPVLQAGTTLDSGFARCEDGFIVRVASAECVDPRGKGECTAYIEGACDDDSNCSEQPYGTCNQAGQSCACRYGCQSDADCQPDQACVCAGVVSGSSRCVSAECLSAEDCTGGTCGLSVFRSACNLVAPALRCWSDGAACRVDSDCPLSQDLSERFKTACHATLGEWACYQDESGAPCG